MRLIDADELKKRAVKVCFPNAPECGEFDAVVIYEIDIMPTIAKQMVLAYEAAFDSMSMAFRLPNTEEFINAGDYYALDAVTHWMPLLEPPEVTP